MNCINFGLKSGFCDDTVDVPLIWTTADTYQKLPYIYKDLKNAATLKYVDDKVIPEIKHHLFCSGKRHLNQIKSTCTQDKSLLTMATGK